MTRWTAPPEALSHPWKYLCLSRQNAGGRGLTRDIERCNQPLVLGSHDQLLQYLLCRRDPPSRA